MSKFCVLFEALTLFRPAENSELYKVISALDGGKSALAASIALNTAVKNGFRGSVWQCLIAHELISNDNPFSRICECRKAAHDTLWQLAVLDCALYRRLFSDAPDSPEWNLLSDFYCENAIPGSIAELAKALANAESDEAFASVLAGHFEKNGVGDFGTYHSFRVSDDASRLIPVAGGSNIGLSALVGYEEQKTLLRENTEAFLNGKNANNVLLYGDAGTGKSTSVQALAGEYSSRGLRIIELYRHQYSLIPALVSQIKDRNYKFILLLDDLSFEEDEVEYKALKSFLEGGASALPKNVRVYATSNRRNLVRETWNDRNDMQHDGDIHRSDTMEEKLSLSSRFGLRIFFPAPTFDEYQQIVSALASRIGDCGLSEDELKSAAATWQVRSGSRSGRTAQQFIDSLTSKKTDS